MGLSDAIYGRVLWPLWARRNHPQMNRFVGEIEREQFDRPADRVARQTAMLQRIVSHAATTVPYYRTVFQQLQISPSNIRSVDDLQKLPPLTKTQIRAHANELRSEAFLNQPTVIKRTSGSTGVPLEIHVDLDGLARKRAATIVADEWSGWRRGRRVAKIWGADEPVGPVWKRWLRSQLFDRAIQLNSLQMTEADIVRFARRLTSFRPSLIYGHAHSLALLASVIRDQALPRWQPDGVISTAMVLHDYQRQLIESVFGRKVINRYGCEEVSLIACECSAHSGLHVNDPSVFVEVLDGDRPAKPGTHGKIIVTDLTNYAMPLLRYEIGDMGVWSNEPCPCGRSSALLASIVGREADYVVTSNGEYVSGISLTDHFGTIVSGIAQLQIIQETIDQFRFRIVRGEGYKSNSESQIGDLVRQRFGATSTFRCEYVSSIPLEPSGKYRFCISNVAKPVAGRAA